MPLYEVAKVLYWFNVIAVRKIPQMAHQMLVEFMGHWRWTKWLETFISLLESMYNIYSCDTILSGKTCNPLVLINNGMLVHVAAVQKT